MTFFVGERRACSEGHEIRIPILGEGDDFFRGGGVDIFAAGRREGGADILVSRKIDF